MKITGKGVTLSSVMPKRKDTRHHFIAKADHVRPPAWTSGSKSNNLRKTALQLKDFWVRLVITSSETPPNSQENTLVIFSRKEV